MPTIQSSDIWRISNRYDTYGKEMLRIIDRNNKDLLYGPTNEEMITAIGKQYIKAFKKFSKIKVQKTGSFEAICKIFKVILKVAQKKVINNIEFILYTFLIYSTLLVSINISSPFSINGGTKTFTPFSRTAGL